MMNWRPKVTKQSVITLLGMVVGIVILGLFDSQLAALLGIFIVVAMAYALTFRKALDPIAGLQAFAERHQLEVVTGEAPINSSLYTNSQDDIVPAPAMVEGQVDGYGFRLLEFYPTLPQTSKLSSDEAVVILMQLAVASSFEFILVSAANGTVSGQYKMDPNFHYVALEGDFNKHFHLYVPKGMENEALQLFDPDSMIDVIDHLWMYSFELTREQFMVYREGLDIMSIASRPDTALSLDVLYDDARQIIDLLVKPLEKVLP